MFLGDQRASPLSEDHDAERVSRSVRRGRVKPCVGDVRGRLSLALASTGTTGRWSPSRTVTVGVSIADTVESLKGFVNARTIVGGQRASTSLIEIHDSIDRVASVRRGRVLASIRHSRQVPSADAFGQGAVLAEQLRQFIGG